MSENHQTTCFLNILDECVNQLLLILSMNHIAEIDTNISYQNISEIIAGNRYEYQRSQFLQAFKPFEAIKIDFKLENFQKDL